MTITTDADAIAAAQEAAEALQEALAYWETAYPSPAVTRLHKLLNLAGGMAEDLTSTATPPFSTPRPADGGTPKN